MSLVGVGAFYRKLERSDWLARGQRQNCYNEPGTLGGWYLRNQQLTAATVYINR
jgi:hypothetical protein